MQRCVINSLSSSRLVFLTMNVEASQGLQITMPLQHVYSMLVRQLTVEEMKVYLQIYTWMSLKHDFIRLLEVLIVNRPQDTRMKTRLLLAWILSLAFCTLHAILSVTSISSSHHHCRHRILFPFEYMREQVYHQHKIDSARHSSTIICLQCWV